MAKLSLKANSEKGSASSSWFAKWLPRWFVGGGDLPSDEQRDYWRQVYPLAAAETQHALSKAEAAKREEEAKEENLVGPSKKKNCGLLPALHPQQHPPSWSSPFS